MPKLDSIKKIALAISIIVVLNLFINFGIQTFYPRPQFEDFCPEELGETSYEDRASCEEVGGRWIKAGVYPYEGAVRPALPTKGEEFNEYCDAYYGCKNQHQDIRDTYQRNVFIALVVAGVAAFTTGLFMVASAAVSSGFVFGGVLSFIIGTIRYWSGMHDYLRFAILGLALAVLIWIGYKKMRE